MIEKIVKAIEKRISRKKNWNKWEVMEEVRKALKAYGESVKKNEWKF